LFLLFPQGFFGVSFQPLSGNKEDPHHKSKKKKTEER